MDIPSIGQRPDVAKLLAQMQDMRAAAGVGIPPPEQSRVSTSAVSESEPVFRNHLVNALDQVNAVQKASGAAADGFVRGEHNSLVDVMVASQKAGVAFQAATQVRNRLVSAYEEIMKMPI